MSDIPKKSFETFVVRFMNQATGILTGILMARVLGAYGKGIFTYVGSVLSVLQTLNAGQSSAISWQYGRLRHPSGAVLGAALRILTFVSLPLLAIVAIVALSVPGQRPLIAVAVALPFSLVAQAALGFFLADGDLRTCNIQATITSTGMLLGLLIAYFIFHLGLTATLVVWVTVIILTAVYSAIKLLPYVGVVTGDVAASIKQQAAFSARVSANAIVALLNFRIDVFIILFMLGAKALGVYSIAIGAGELMWQVNRPLGLSAFQRINSEAREDAIHITAKCVRHSLVMVATGCILIFFVAPPLITVVYGRAFTDAGLVLRILLPGIIAYSMTPFFSGFFNQQLGRPTITLTISLMSTVLCAIITIATVKHLGIVGGALATSISYAAALIVNVFLFKRETGLSLRSMFTFGPDDLRPYKELAEHIWRRTSAFARGKRA